MAALVGGGLLGGTASVWAWVTSPSLSPYSERLWTTLNRMFEGRSPGMASDLELVLVFSLGCLFTGAALALVWRSVRG